MTHDERLPGAVRVAFSSLPNSVLTLVSLVLLFELGWVTWDYLIANSVVQRFGGPAVDAKQCVAAGGFCWAFLQDRWRSILFGNFPYDEQWRAAVATALFLGLIVYTAWKAVAPGRPSASTLIVIWPLTVFAVLMLMAGGLFGLERVPMRLWSGLPLTLLLAFIGIALGFVAGLALALGRRDGPPLTRWFCTAYIELFRGVPLVSFLLISSILLPLLLPAGVEVDKLVRAQLMFSMFFSAYLAEAIRGGLQAVATGQVSAARALGLSWWQSQRRVVLPQAVRLVLPSLVNLILSALKDTSLVAVIGMSDLLGTTNSAFADPRWFGLFVEPYAFIAAIYFTLCFSISVYSRGVEMRSARITR